jgi:hypothetical protein
MPSLITRRFRIHNAKQFQEAVDEAAPSNLYFFISRITPWGTETSPPTPTDTIQANDFDIWRNMIAMKKVGTADTTFAIPRYNWNTGNVYHQYDSANTSMFAQAELYSTPAHANTFYVVNQNFNVYKCLSNNKGVASTVEPTGTSQNILNTADGYRWKFMYTIESGARLKFLNENWMPVKTIASDDGSSQWDVQNTAANGAIDVIQVTSGGNSYVYNTGTLSAVTSSTEVKLPASANAFNGVYTGSSMYLTSGTGAGQVRTITSYAGATKTVKLDTAFVPTPANTTTYQIAPTITITGDGTLATAQANVTNGVINTITVVSPGSNYSNATIAITANSSHGTGGAARAMIPPPGGHGSDPVSELGGHNVILNTLLSGTESDTFMSVNNFRTVGILKDPRLRSTGAIANSSTFDLTTKLTLSTVSGSGNFKQDEVVTGGTSGATAKLAQFSNTNSANTAGSVRLVDVNGNFAVNETITAANTGITSTVTLVTKPLIRSFAGDVIYIENRSPVTRSSDQIEDIKLVVKF